jgi:hypothetical protein
VRIVCQREGKSLPPRIVAVNIVNGVPYSVTVHCNGKVGELSDKAGIAQIGLTPARFVITLLAADEAALGVPVSRLPIITRGTGKI